MPQAVLRDASPVAVAIRDPKFAVVPLESADRASTVRAALAAAAAANRAEAAEAAAQDAEAGVIAALAGVSLSNATLNATDRAFLASLDHTLNLPAFLSEIGREGTFKPRAVNLSTQVANDPQQGVYVAFASDPTGSSGAWVRAEAWPLRPEYFGARGDESTNDTVAFQGLATYVNWLGAGHIEYAPGAVYIVGLQDDHSSAPTQSDGTGTGNFRYTAQPILTLRNLTGLVLQTNGSIMRAANGLRHGAFNAGGSAMASANGYQGIGASSAYGAMVYLVNIENFWIDVHLDGNSQNLYKGGPWGDTGWQIGGTGLQLENCSHGYIDVRSYWHPSDGIQYAGACTGITSPDENVRFGNAISILNGRQGLSLIGGKGLIFDRYDFSFNGKGSQTVATSAHPFQSSPASGIDIECEGVREAHFVDFVHGRIACNYGAAMLYAGGGASHVTFGTFEFIGDVGYTLYCAGSFPYVKFGKGQVVGCALWQGTSGDGATHFECDFFDDASLSPTGVAYDGNSILNGDGSGGSLLDGSRFFLTGNATAPISVVDWVFRNTTLRQANTVSTPIGGFYFHGVNDWTIPNVDLGGTTANIYSANNRRWFDRFILNGVLVSTEPQLLSFHGTLRQGYDGANQHAYRNGIWSDPVGWATQVGGANVGDTVDISVPTIGAPSRYICNTAPGTASLAQWTPMGIFGLKQATGGLVDIPDGSDLPTVITWLHGVAALLRGTSLFPS